MEPHSPKPEKVALVIPTRTIVKVILFVLATWLLVDVGRLVASAMLLLAVAIFLAVALDPAVRLIQRRGLARLWSVVVLGIVGLVLVSGAMAIFLQPLTSQVTKLAEDAPHLKQDLLEHKTIDRINDKTGIVDRGAHEVEKLPETLADDATEIVAVIAHGLIGALTLVFLTAFLLIEGPQITRGALTIWPQLATKRSWGLIESAYKTIGDYVGGTMLVAALDGVVILVLLLIFGSPFILPLALWAALWGIVPIVGGFVGTMPAVIVAFTLGAVPGFVVLAGSMLYHVVGRSILHPAIVGKAIEMSAFFVFLSILVGESVLGIIGILLAVPIAGIIQLLISDVLEARAAADEAEAGLAVLSEPSASS